ncbi:MAG TPA: rRNA adenine dimethyltransferase family protein, partial [Pyrinomonadaceae bacterium]|nr:rRNA adenine dimethyltransferase family protein [Pyrinomonadaceae bacterium]
QRLMEQRACLAEMVLMLQREVVERITAPPGSGERGYLSVLVEAYCEAEALFDVPPSAFRPVPKVWSTVVRLRMRGQVAVDVRDEQLLWRVVGAGFAQRRKTIFNNLRSAPADLRSLIEAGGGAGVVLETADLDARRRAETLTLEEWGRLARVLETA